MCVYVCVGGEGRWGYLRVLPPTKVVSAVVLPHGVTAGVGARVGADRRQRPCRGG